MKRYFFFVLFIAVMAIACKKEATSTPLDTHLTGTWKMIAVTTPDSVVTKPAGESKDIHVKFYFNDATSGGLSATLTRAQVGGNFTISDSGSIKIPWITIKYPASDVLDGSDSWDKQFTLNITIAQTYSIDSTGYLSICCLNKRVLKFAKE
ncbi:MAG: hypothetical protein QM731_11895 [Chitinophagaceae bacterium]